MSKLLKNTYFNFQNSFWFTVKLRYRKFPYTFWPYTCIASSINNIPDQGGTFVTIDEPTLTHHNHSKIIVYLGFHSWCCTLYGFEQMCNDMCPPLQCQAGSFHCSKNPMCSAIHPYFLLTPVTIDRFALSIVLTFPECHIFGIIQYFIFSEWLLSHSNMHFKFPLCLFMA